MSLANEEIAVVRYLLLHQSELFDSTSEQCSSDAVVSRQQSRDVTSGLAVVDSPATAQVSVCLSVCPLRASAGVE